MALSLRVKILETFGPSKFTVRPEMLEGEFYHLQSRLDLHYGVEVGGDRKPPAVREGDTVWLVLRVPHRVVNLCFLVSVTVDTGAVGWLSAHCMTSCS